MQEFGMSGGGLLAPFASMKAARCVPERSDPQRGRIGDTK